MECEENEKYKNDSTEFSMMTDLWGILKLMWQAH